MAESTVPESNPKSLDELNTEVADLRVAFTEAYDAEAPLPELNELAEKIEALDAEIAANIAATEQEVADRAALAERITPAPAAEEIETEDVVVVDDAAEVIEEDPTTPTAEQEVEAPIVADEIKEPVAASVRPTAPSASAVAQRTATPVAPDTASEVVITASADVPGFANGQQIDRLGIARAMHARARGMGDSNGRQTVFNVASIESPVADEFIIRDGSDDPSAIIAAAVDAELKGKDADALVASGGWCAPSETMYDLFSVESSDGLLDLPTVGIARGGMQVPAYIGIGDVSGGIWNWNETLDNDGSSTKPCLQIPCPSFTDVRLEAEGLCITAGNLTDRAFPELTARIVDLAVTAQQHAVSNGKIAKIVASATAVTVTAAPSDAAGDILNAIDLQVADYRSQHLMGSGTVLDAIIPHWALGSIRATLAMRSGVEMLAVTDAEVVSYFTARQVRPQFVVGYEPLFDTTPATAWPTTTKVLLYPTGGYVAGDGGTLDLGVVRDSTLNSTNDFTAAWAEQFYSVMQLGPAAREVTITAEVNGITGGHVNGGTTVTP